MTIQQPIADLEPQNRPANTAPTSVPASTPVTSSEESEPAQPAATSPANRFIAPQAISNPAPVYPDLARRRGWQGDVLLRVGVGADGGVLFVKVLKTSGHQLLDRSARQQVERWRFAPARRDGVVTESEVELPVSFRLK